MAPRLLAVALAAGLLVPCAAGSRTVSPDTRLDRALAQLVAAPGGPPGAIAVVQRGSHRVVLRHGVADRASGARIALADRWRIASVSKAFSGAVALQLVAAGRLRLSDTIARRVPNLPRAWGRVTLAEALQHTSGLPDFSASAGFRAHVKNDPRQGVLPAQLLAWAAGEPVRFAPPGSRYEYSNTDNVVVGFFVQAATGKSYERALRERVLAPLGLRATLMPVSYLMPRPYVRGYDGGEDVSEVLNPRLSWAAGALVSTPLELTRFIRWYAPRPPSVFRPGESQPQGPGTNSAGLGVFRYRTPCGTVYGHTGNYLGYTTFIAASRDGRRSIVVQASVQLSKTSGDPRAYQALRETFSRGVCAAFS